MFNMLANGNIFFNNLFFFYQKCCYTISLCLRTVCLKTFKEILHIANFISSFLQDGYYENSHLIGHANSEKYMLNI